MNSQTLQENPILFIYLPLLHVLWSDMVLTPTEIKNISDLIDADKLLNDNQKEIIRNYLDPLKPPTPTEMKGWLSEIKRGSVNLSVKQKVGLIDIGIKLSETNGYQPNGKTEEKARQSLREIASALAIDTNEPISDFIPHLPGSGIPVSKASFDIQALKKVLQGSHQEIIQKVKTIISDPKFAYLDSDDPSLYREQVLEWCQHLAKQGFGSFAYPEEYGGKNDMGGYFAIMETLSYHDLSLVIKFGVQFGLFGMSVLFLGTRKHHDKYLADIGTLHLPGSFAMTETGHGSNVNGIETTATYNHDKKSFVIHTPNDAARKDYIGNAAVHAKMATVFAKLILDGNDFGVNAFMVPIRDKKGHPLPGIKLEDCGKKMGLNGVDNGRIWFDQVVIPLENMLDRYANINEKGEFESPIASDGRRFFTMLGTLVGGRIGIPRSALSAAKSGLTIAIKYGDQRKQFGPKNGQEISILDYRTHQRRLMPLLANAYALHFSLQYLTKRFLSRSENDMQEIEAMAAGLKSFATWNTTATLQTCREACGGQGYMHENRLDSLKNDTDIFTTFEGDNTVLLQLVAKSRLTDFKQEFHDVNFFGIVNYITNQAKTAMVEMNPVIIRNTDESHLLDPDFQLQAFKYRERDILASAAKRLKKHLDTGMGSFDAFNQCQYHLLQVGLAYIERIILEQFIKQVQSTKDEELKRILKKLCDLFALSQMEKNKGWYLEQDYMNGVKTKAIRKLVNKLCLEVRQEAVPLVDAFDIPDSCLAAPIAFGKN